MNRQKPQDLTAMILAAGKGSRLGALSLKSPKALVLANGEPMLKHTIDRLKIANVKRIVINLFHLGEQIREYLNRCDYFGIEIEFSEESKLYDTGGSIRYAQNLLPDSGSFFIHNCDIYTTYPLEALNAYHEVNKNFASLLVMNRPSSRQLLFTEEGALAGWRNTHTNEEKIIHRLQQNRLIEYAFCGIQVISASVFKYMKDEEEVFSIITTLLRAAEEGEKIMAFPAEPHHYWADVGTIEKLDQLSNYLKSSDVG